MQEKLHNAEGDKVEGEAALKEIKLQEELHNAEGEKVAGGAAPEGDKVEGEELRLRQE